MQRGYLTIGKPSRLAILLSFAGIFLLGIGASTLVQFASAQTPPAQSPVDLVIGIVFAISGIITVAGSIITWAVNKIKNSAIYEKLDARAKAFIDALGDVAKSMEGTDKGVTEHANMLKVLAEIGVSSPQGKEIMEKNGLTIEQFYQNLKDWQADLVKFYGTTQPLPEDQSDDSKIRELAVVRKNFVPATLYESSGDAM